MQEKTHRSQLVNKWDRIFRDICREIVCPPALVEQDNDGRHLEVGWQRDAAGLDESGVLHAEADFKSDIILEGDVGSEIGSGVFIEGGINLEGDDVKPWDVDLGEFMNDVEEDADAATMLGGNGEFDLDAEATADDPSQSADLASESQAGGNSSFFDQSQGPADSSFFDQAEAGPTPLSEMASSSMLGPGLGATKFTGWQVTGLICCSLLLLFGGLLTFDLVRTIGSPNDMPLANPIVGGLAGVFGWN